MCNRTICHCLHHGTPKHGDMPCSNMRNQRGGRAIHVLLSKLNNLSSKVDRRLEMHSLQLGRDDEHHRLRPIFTPIDTAHGAHVLRGYMVLTINTLNHMLEVVEEDPTLKDNVV